MIQSTFYTASLFSNKSLKEKKNEFLSLKMYKALNEMFKKRKIVDSKIFNF